MCCRESDINIRIQILLCIKILLVNSDVAPRRSDIAVKFRSNVLLHPRDSDVLSRYLTFGRNIAIRDQILLLLQILLW
jgi:hypothetical protein